MDLQVRSVVQGGWKVVLVAGELDAETTSVLSDHLEQQVPEPIGHVVVDLAELSFMDSTGLALLVSWHRKLAAGGGEFRLAALRPSVHKLFRLTDLTAVMHIHDSVQHATAQA
jgi:anti-sigma B factor antagonist